MRKKLSDIWAYLTGNYRYHIYYSRNIKWLMRSHIKEQIECRIQSMDRECFNNGQCKLCGCKTTALQMASKACDKPCYPPMMGYTVWNSFKMASLYSSQWWTIDGISWRIEGKKFVKMYERV